MIGSVYILDANLDMVGMVDAYISFIWAKRYAALGDCELYVDATPENVDLLRVGRYIVRDDDDMVCRIERIEIDTDPEAGNRLVITGNDARRLLHRRIVWETTTLTGNAEIALHDLVDAAVGVTASDDRVMLKPNGTLLIGLGRLIGLPQATSEQISYRNVGEKVEEYCTRFGWGWKMPFDRGALRFQLYTGRDLRSVVVFSPDFENLNTTRYIEDHTVINNVALIGGQGEGSSRRKAAAGDATGVERVEVFVDAKSIGDTVTWRDMTAVYPTVEEGGQGYITAYGTAYAYALRVIDIPVLDARQLALLQTEYPNGTVITVDGVEFFRAGDVAIATLDTPTPDDDTEAVWLDVIYDAYLINAGYDALADRTAAVAFDASVDPATTFVYKRDYDLGDIVTISNEFGITFAARIVEAIEVADDGGYRFEPKFEFYEED